ncbi:MAG: ADP-ribosylglycohydrolase family protein [Planctomycetaceae bacterium]|jgi:ADP-ribosylglycohydrolase|nr:ADP-ribosylglycohydrolase family protein [Planctomycetaceae bacterium]
MDEKLWSYISKKGDPPDALRFSTDPYADIATQFTHNHPEGLKSARAVVASITISLQGVHKEDIKRRIEKIYGYRLDSPLDEIRKTYSFNETCQETVPEAITAFLESHNYVSAVQNAISLGGDADTLAAIAEAYYQEIPEELVAFAESKLPQEIWDVLVPKSK